MIIQIKSKKNGIVKFQIDHEDYELVSKHTWSAVKDGSGSLRIMAWGGKRGASIYLSRLIMGNPNGNIVDHINGDTLDNRKCNLRICEEKENLLNRKRYSTNKSGVKGVDLYRGERWRTQIQVFGKKIHIGYYKTKEQAALAYNEAAIKYHGKFARLNEVTK